MKRHYRHVTAAPAAATVTHPQMLYPDTGRQVGCRQSDTSRHEMSSVGRLENEQQPLGDRAFPVAAA